MVRSISTLNKLRSDLRDWHHAYLRTCDLSFPNYELECSQANSQLLDQFLADLIDANLANLSKQGRVAPFVISGWIADVMLDVEALEKLFSNLRAWFDAYQLVWDFGVTPSDLERSTEYYKLLSALLVELIDFNLTLS